MRYFCWKIIKIAPQTPGLASRLWKSDIESQILSPVEIALNSPGKWPKKKSWHLIFQLLCQPCFPKFNKVWYTIYCTVYYLINLTLKNTNWYTALCLQKSCTGPVKIHNHWAAAYHGCKPHPFAALFMGRVFHCHADNYCVFIPCPFLSKSVSRNLVYVIYVCLSMDIS